MTADTANGGLSQLETHYKTFIVSLPKRIMFTLFYSIRRQNRILQRLQELDLTLFVFRYRTGPLRLVLGSLFFPRLHGGKF